MLIDGKKIAEQKYADLKKRVSRLSFEPLFCDILVGNNPASRQYVEMKAKAAERIGVTFLRAEFPEEIPEDVLIAQIQKINGTPRLAGLIVQLPLPERFNRVAVLDALDVPLDVDCLTSTNTAAFYSGTLTLTPPTPAAVLEVLDSVLVEKDLSKKIVVIGKGELVGRPVAHLLRQRGYNVHVIDRSTSEPETVAREAGILIAAAGRPGLVTASWVKPGGIVIDAGSAEQDGSIVGDVDAESVTPIAAFLSPTPGGGGPV